MSCGIVSRPPGRSRHDIERRIRFEKIVTPADWQHRRQAILKAMQEIMGRGYVTADGAKFAGKVIDVGLLSASSSTGTSSSYL